MYYGAYMVGEFLGKDQKAKVVEIATNSSTIGGYSIYENNKLARSILINYSLYLPGAEGERPAETVNISGPNSGKNVSIKRFYTPYTNSKDGL